eukprot:CAMPEP_0184870922 /NCGR_PEP_ID=MMETSP0580-20130426/39241_1 /TAXON_ID=1118495 /ORGANISM="Dactyliosolen fragilissimus" /LENGTH=331 /DNA_ID=CAMNT_0027373299 /DNA_START=21 /DNA_END=1016 /DNA_ORIENTATION=+
MLSVSQCPPDEPIHGKSDLQNPERNIPTLDKNESVQLVSFGPLSGEPSSEPYTFFTTTHFNTQGFGVALLSSSTSSNNGVSPALHFKGLSHLLAQFISRYDLGGDFGVHDPEHEDTNTIKELPTPAPVPITRTDTIKHAFAIKDQSSSPPKWQTNEPIALSDKKSSNPIMQQPTLQIPNPLPSDRNHHSTIGGDFADDLLPHNPQLLIDPNSFPSHDITRPTTNGNLMGPSHPAFRQFDDQDDDLDGSFNGTIPPFGIPLPRGGGVGMTPRFDPIYPPGIADNVNRGGRGGRGRRGTGRGRGWMPNRPIQGGDPNPDHARPPSDLNNHMFM